MIYQNFIRVLNIDLENEKIRIDQREDLMQYLGGVGVASRLLEENMHPGLDPLDPRQPIIFAIGPLTYVFPVMTKAVAMFVSPLTGELGESYAGGRFGSMLFSAGFDAVVISGKARRPSFLSILPDNVIFRDARAVWGGAPGDNVGRILRDLEFGRGKRSFIRIGEAGENLVSYAMVIVDSYRHFGRLGLGAVMGSKFLKAIAINGGRSTPIKHFQEYAKTYREIYQKCVSTDMMSKYHDVGTPINIEPLNAIGALPTENMRRSSYEKAGDISGEAFSSQSLARKMACVGCPVGCIHIGMFRRKFAEHGHEYETVLQGYDYELIFALGSYLCIGHTDDILEMIEAVEETGLDAISTGVALGWATEALEKGIISLNETIVPLKFGDKEHYQKAIVHIAKAANEFYRLLGKGVRAASDHYGGKEFAMHVAGNEMAGYHTGYGSLVGAAIGARHSHLCNGGYSIDQDGAKFDPTEMLDKLEKEEVERCMLNSLVMCLFARKVYDRPTVLSALKSLGLDLSDDELSAISLRNYKTKLRIKNALGFSLENVKLPKRFFETSSFNGIIDEKIAHDMLLAYQKRVGELMNELPD